ncbi:hypothetical protein DID78_04980 [Candidatus Marinamargulisbacteria bacterium SCGC AG-343-D04]|nr:hypothetical protein DID78_04980 [Candidatus Marinamargulisbacteria bacterium SCGC AG-343-D04]
MSGIGGVDSQGPQLGGSGSKDYSNPENLIFSEMFAEVLSDEFDVSSKKRKSGAFKPTLSQEFNNHIPNVMPMGISNVSSTDSKAEVSFGVSDNRVLQLNDLLNKTLKFELPGLL